MLLDKKELKDFLKKNPIKSKDELNDVLKQLNKQVIEAMLEGELTHELGYEQNDKSEKETENRRNGYSSKKVITSTGELEINVPRDRKSEFEPVIVKKNESDISGFEDKIISMYALGLTTRDIQKYVLEIYGYEISETQVSIITNKVLEKVKEWQNRPLTDLYPIVFLDAMVLKIRKDGIVKNSAVYGIIGITIDGNKECLGLWIGESESSKFWLYVLNEIKNRGVKDILIFSVDNLNGISEAIKAVFPTTEIQKCIVHQIRNSLAFVSWKDRKDAASELKNIYRAPTEEQGLIELKKFKENKYDTNYILEIINHSSFRRLAIQKSTGSTRERIGLTELRQLPVKVPKDKSEQTRIANILVTLRSQLDLEHAMFIKLGKLKLAVIASLLAGSVPIKFAENINIQGV